MTTVIVNLTEIQTVDKIVAQIEALRPIVNPAVVQKANECTVRIDTASPAAYRVASPTTGVIYNTDVDTGRCSCEAGQHGQACSHLLAAARRHVQVTVGYNVAIEAQREAGDLVIIIS